MAFGLKFSFISFHKQRVRHTQSAIEHLFFLLYSLHTGSRLTKMLVELWVSRNTAEKIASVRHLHLYRIFWSEGLGILAHNLNELDLQQY